MSMEFGWYDIRGSGLKIVWSENFLCGEDPFWLKSGIFSLCGVFDFSQNPRFRQQKENENGSFFAKFITS